MKAAQGLFISFNEFRTSLIWPWAIPLGSILQPLGAR